jgi:hypothetical protein
VRRLWSVRSSVLRVSPSTLAVARALVGLASLAVLVGCTGGSGSHPSSAEAPATASAGSAGGLSAQAGVLTLTVDGRKVTHPRWTPGTISGGLPIPLTADAAAQAVDRWRSLRGCAGLSAEPSSR